MLSDFRAVAWLKARHLRTGFTRIMYVAGTDIREDDGVFDRLYQLYFLAFLGICLALSYAALAGQVETLAAALDPAYAGSFAYGYLNLVLGLFLLSAIAAIREVPLKLSPPDIGYLAASSIRTAALTVTEACMQSSASLLLGLVGGFLLGTALEAFSGIGVSAWAAACFTGLLLFTANMWAWTAGMVPFAAPRRLRRRMRVIGYIALPSAAALLSLATAALPFGAGFFTLLTLDNLPVAVLPVLLCLALCVLALERLSARVDMTAVIDANWLSAELHALRGMKYQDPQRYAEIARQKKLARRGPRLHLPQASGRSLLVARAALAHVRRFESLPGLMAWCAALIPAGVALLLTTPDPAFMFLWLMAALQFSGSAGAATLVFAEDVANRAIRDHLPYSTLTLLVFDSLPAFSAMILITVASSAVLCVTLGLSAVSMALSALLAGGLVLCGGLAAVKPAFAKKPLSFGAALFVMLIPVCLLVFTDSPVFAVVGVAAVLLFYMLLIQNGQEV